MDPYGVGKLVSDWLYWSRFYNGRKQTVCFGLDLLYQPKLNVGFCQCCHKVNQTKEINSEGITEAVSFCGLMVCLIPFCQKDWMECVHPSTGSPWNFCLCRNTFTVSQTVSCQLSRTWHIKVLGICPPCPLMQYTNHGAIWDSCYVFI